MTVPLAAAAVMDSVSEPVPFLMTPARESRRPTVLGGSAAWGSRDASERRANDMAFSSEAGAPSCRSMIARGGPMRAAQLPFGPDQRPAERGTEPGIVCCNALLDGAGAFKYHVAS